MQNFTNQELANMHFVYGLCNGSALAAQREYQLRYPNRRQPGRRLFSTLHTRLSENGSFRRLHGQGRPLMNHNRANVLEYFEDNPCTSIRTASRATNVPPAIVQRIVKVQGLHPYHYQRVQDLREQDFIPRMAFCNWIINNDNIRSLILWSDEKTFTRNGSFNIHNVHYWIDHNPRLVRRTNFQHRFSINLWAGIIGNQLIGLIEIPNRLNGETYLNFLQTNLFDLLEEVPLNVRRDMYFQHDGAPPHNSGNVRNWLDDNFPGRWIGRSGPISWPSRAPDLNPVDYYLWGRLNDLVYQDEVNSREELLERIRVASNTVRENRFQILRASQSITGRATLCLQQNGDHFEQLL